MIERSIDRTIQNRERGSIRYRGALELKKHLNDLKKSGFSEDNLYYHTNFSFDPNTRFVHVGGKDRRLSTVQARLLTVFMEAPNELQEKYELINRALGEGYQAHNLSTHIGGLRRKLGDKANKPEIIVPISGFGYVFCDPPLTRENSKEQRKFLKHIVRQRDRSRLH